MLGLFSKRNKNEVVVRIAPSPTGKLHIGTVRSTLFNYLYAKNKAGKFILRIEDTDKERSKEEYEKDILNGLKWLGLEYDEMFRQSERGEIYKRYIEKMLESGDAYISKEEPKEEEQRGEVIRFKNPNKKITFNDEIRGEVTFDTSDLGDFIIAKSVNEPLYHLAVVVDDHEMGVTHVIRGEDHISNTPRQILIQEAINAKRPVYGHIPLVLDKDKSKLSKRKHGESVWLDTYKDRGYLKDAILNYLALLGWNPGTDKEIFTLEELVKEFSLDKVQKGGAVFDTEKLKWVNKEHLKKLPSSEVHASIYGKIGDIFPGKEIPEGLAEIVLERISLLSDVDEMARVGELDYFFRDPELDTDKIIWKKDSKEDTIKHLKKSLEIVKEDKDLMVYAEEVGKGSVLWPVRYALSGKEKSPDPFTLLKILGKDQSIERINNAIRKLEEF